MKRMIKITLWSLIAFGHLHTAWAESNVSAAIKKPFYGHQGLELSDTTTNKRVHLGYSTDVAKQFAEENIESILALFKDIQKFALNTDQLQVFDLYIKNKGRDEFHGETLNKSVFNIEVNDMGQLTDSGASMLYWTIPHELFHKYQASYLDKAPQWFREGEAQWVAGQIAQKYHPKAFSKMMNKLHDAFLNRPNDYSLTDWVKHATFEEGEVTAITTMPVVMSDGNKMVLSDKHEVKSTADNVVVLGDGEKPSGETFSMKTLSRGEKASAVFKLDESMLNNKDLQAMLNGKSGFIKFDVNPLVKDKGLANYAAAYLLFAHINASSGGQINKWRQQVLKLDTISPETVKQMSMSQLQSDISQYF